MQAWWCVLIVLIGRSWRLPANLAYLAKCRSVRDSVSEKQQQEEEEDEWPLRKDDQYWLLASKGTCTYIHTSLNMHDVYAHENQHVTASDSFDKLPNGGCPTDDTVPLRAVIGCYSIISSLSSTLYIQKKSHTQMTKMQASKASLVFLEPRYLLHFR